VLAPSHPRDALGVVAMLWRISPLAVFLPTKAY